MDEISLAMELLLSDEAIDRRQEKVRRAFLCGTFDDFLAAEDQAREKQDGDSDRSDESGCDGERVTIVDAVAG